MRVEHVLTVVFLLTGLPVVVSGAEPGAALERIQELGQACQSYMAENNGRPPPSLATLYYQAYVPDLGYFTHPLNPEGLSERAQIDTASDYVLSHTLTDPGLPVPAVTVDGAEPLVQERAPTYNEDRGIYVFYTDASVRFHSISGEVSVATPPATHEAPEGLAPIPECADLSGAWTQKSHGVPCPSTFHLTRREDGTYDVREEGCGFARGTARRVGNGLRIDWKVHDYCEGYYIWPLNDDCSGTQGKGTLVFTHPTDDPRSCNKGTHETIGTRK